MDLRITAAGRAAARDPAATLRLTRLALGSGRGDGGAADAGRTTLRTERDSAAAAGTSSARAAAATLGAGNAAVTVTAAAAGPDGNAVTVTLALPGASEDLAVDVAGNAVTVTLATDADRDLTTTAAALVAALSAAAAAGALVTAAVPAGSDGTGVVAAAAATPLAGGQDAAAAAATLGAGNAAVTVTAAAAGAAGNAITITLVDPDAASQALAVAVDGTTITVSLATDAAEDVTSTAADVVAAITADQNASALATAALPAGSDGTSAVAAAAATPLAGGQAAAAAAATLGAGNAAVTVTAAAAGAAGNAITVAFLDPAASQPLAVAVDGSAVTITLATDAADDGSTTAAALVAAITADQDVSALLTAALPAGSDGAGVVAPAAIALAGGQAADLLAVRAVVDPTAPDYAVSEVGVFARLVGAGGVLGAEILFAFWTDPAAALAHAQPGTPVVVPVWIDGRDLAATLTVAAAADVTLDAAVAFTDLTDTPAHLSGHAQSFLRVTAAEDGVEAVSPADVAAWLHAATPLQVVAAVRDDATNKSRTATVAGPDYPCRWLVIAAGGGAGDNPLNTPGGYDTTVTPEGQTPVVVAAGGVDAGFLFDFRVPGGGVPDDLAASVPDRYRYRTTPSLGDLVVPHAGAAASGRGEPGTLVISLITPVRGRRYVVRAGDGDGHILILELRQ